MVNQMLQQSKDWILKNKVATFLSVALFAMVITTIALAVSNNNNASDLEECVAEVDVLMGLTSTQATTTDVTQQPTASSEINDGSTTTELSMETTPLTVVTTTTNQPATTVDPTVINYRLPGDNIPLHYDLTLHPDLEQDTFTGKVAITIETVRANEQVVLHSHLLQLGPIRFRCLNDSSYTYINTNVDDKLDFLKINLNKALPLGYVSELTIEFSGRLDAGIVGFYGSSYTDADGAKTYSTGWRHRQPVLFDERDADVNWRLGALLYQKRSGYFR